MIQSFKHRGLEKFFNEGSVKGIQAKHSEKIADILDQLDAASKVEDMNFPGSDLHPLQPRKEGIWAVKVSGAWRITFRFENGHAYFVDYLNYH